MANATPVESMTLDERVESFIQEMPKVELHVHLEGAVLPETLIALAARHSVELPAKDLAGIRDFYTFRDFDHFVGVYMKINDCLQTAEDVGDITEELGNEAARQNIRYLEVTISPGSLVFIHGLTFERIYEEIKAGAERARQRHGVRMQYIVDVVRDMPPHIRRAGAEFAIRAQGDGVVALGLGGTEARYPPEQFIDLFDLAYDAGLPSVPHAGETVGPESVWGALNYLHPVRLGHGVRSIEDPELVEHLAARQIPLEISPTSNICTGAIPSWEVHPIRKLYDAGTPISVNSDDPPMFNTTLTDEYLLLYRRFGFTLDEIESLTLGALAQSFLPPEDRATLDQEFRDEFRVLRGRYGLENG